MPDSPYTPDSMPASPVSPLAQAAVAVRAMYDNLTGAGGFTDAQACRIIGNMLAAQTGNGGRDHE